MSHCALRFVGDKHPSYLRALTDKSTLVPDTVCKCCPYESLASSLGFVLLWGLSCHISDYYGHAQAEGILLLYNVFCVRCISNKEGLKNTQWSYFVM